MQSHVYRYTQYEKAKITKRTEILASWVESNVCWNRGETCNFFNFLFFLKKIHDYLNKIRELIVTYTYIYKGVSSVKFLEPSFRQSTYNCFRFKTLSHRVA